jgi:chromosome segregation ATPase
MKEKNTNLGNFKKFVQDNVKKIHLEEQLKKVNSELETLKEGEEQQEEQPYQKNTYEGYESDLQEVAKCLSEACQVLETAVLKQDSHSKKLPEVTERMNEGKKAKDVLLDIYKEVKAAKLNTERKIYQ